MNCPACSDELTQVTVGNVTVDICKDSCGGIWFDAGELEQYEKAASSAPAELLRPLRNPNVAVDRNKTRNCPRCASSPLTKRFFDGEYEIQVDQCLHCGGIFLDPGELETIRHDHEDVAARQSVIDRFMKEANTSNPDPKHSRGLKAVLGLIFR
ncbi:MAG: zf-TFIIB domain-containing protein [Bdellovibrionota bacterium]